MPCCTRRWRRARRNTWTRGRGGAHARLAGLLRATLGAGPPQPGGVRAHARQRIAGGQQQQFDVPLHARQQPLQQRLAIAPQITGLARQRPRRAISRTRAPAPAAHDARWRRRATTMRRWRPARAGPACPPACAIRLAQAVRLVAGCGGVFSQGPAFQLVRFRAPGQGLAGVAAPQGDGGELAQAGQAMRAGLGGGLAP